MDGSLERINFENVNTVDQAVALCSCWNCRVQI